MGPRPQDGREIMKEELSIMMKKNGDVQAWDEISGKALGPKLVAEARRVEMDYFEAMQVYTRVPRDHQKQTGGKIMSQMG